MTRFKTQDVLLKLSEISAETIHSMDSNIELMNNIIRLHENLGRSRNGPQDSIPMDRMMNQADYYTEQVQLMKLRTNYFEAQVNILAAHTTFNSLIKETDGTNDDKDTNWRTTEATLENLYLEYHYHTIKFRELVNASNMHKDTYPPTPPKDDSVTSTRLKNKQSRALLLKPLRTSAKRNSRLLDSPETPRSHYDDTFNDTSVTLQSPTTENLPRKNLYSVLETVENPTYKEKKMHKRSTSMPVTPTSQIVGKFSEFNGSVEEQEEEKSNQVRHFISYDTGLNEYVQNSIPIIADNSSIIKESEIFESYDEQDHHSTFSLESLTFDDDTDEVLETKSTLKKSKSHDSIFQLKNETPVMYGSSSWMNKLSQKILPTVESFNITAEKSLSKNTDFVNIPKSSPINDSFLQNFNSFLIPHHPANSKNDISNAKTSKQLLNAVATHNYLKKLEKTSSSYPNPSQQKVTDDNTDPYIHQINSEPSGQDTHPKSQWSSLLLKLKPQNLIPPSSVVTSEIGKPLLLQQQQQSPVAKKFHNSESTNRGSYSTLTIGPNHSRTINYGTDQDLNFGNVLSSKISHSALNDALSDCAFY